MEAASHSRMRFYASLYLFIAGFYLLTASGRIGLSDSVAMLNVAQSVINQRSFSSEPCEADLHDPTTGLSVGCVPGIDGRHYAGYGLVPSLMVVPAILGARSISGFAHVNPLVTSKAGVSVFSLLLAALVCVVLAVWILKLGYDRGTAVVAACILAFGSPFWHFGVKGFFSEPYFTLALLLAACLLSSPRRRFACALAGLAFGVACAARLNGIILFPAFILAMAFHVRAHKLGWAQFRRDSLQFSAALSISALLIAYANYARFGSPFKTGYQLAFPSTSALLSHPLFDGMLKVLFSGEFGLLVFAPWVVVALICFPRFVREHLPESVLCGTTFLVALIFFSKFSHASGGWVAGPRYLVPTLPFLVLAMAPVLQRLQQPSLWNKQPWVVVGPLMVVCLALGFLIQAAGTIFPDERYFALTEFYKDKPAKPWWSGSIPLASFDFLAHMSSTKVQSARAGEFDQFTARHEGERAYASADSAVTEQEYLNLFPNPENMTSPNLMLLKLRLMGIPLSVGIAYLLAVIAIAFTGVLGLRRCLAL